MKLLFDLAGSKFEGLYAIIEIEKVGVDRLLFVAEGIKSMGEHLEKVVPKDVDFMVWVYKGIPRSEVDAFPIVDDRISYEVALSSARVEIEKELLDGTEVFLVPLRNGRSSVYFNLSPVLDDDNSYEVCTSLSFDPEELSAAIDIDTPEKALRGLGDPRALVQHASRLLLKGSKTTTPHHPKEGI